MTIEVTGCRLLVQPLNPEELDPRWKSAKAMGIIGLDQTERQLQAHAEKGKLLQIGPKASEEYIQGAKIGDTIGFTKYGGKFVKDKEDDENLLIINDEDVICIFKE